MVFNSFFFLLIFLPLVLLGWFGLNRVHTRAADLFLIGMSLWFYGSFHIWYLPVLAVSVTMNYLTGLKTVKREGDAGHVKQRALFLALGIVLNLLLLGIFKYISSFTLLSEIGLPVGLSFYTFSQISYLVDLNRGESCPESFVDYLLYITYFPKIAEGPITRYGEIASQFHDKKKRKPDGENLIRGFVLLFLGMGKKLLIADTLAPAASFGLQSAWYLDTLSVFVVMSCYALQLYFDFSGFCDMALGISRMLNIDLPLNFDAPYKAVTFSDFWKRWHRTLTRFFTKYVYIPLGGSRRGTARACLNIMIVFLLSAFWHGTGTTYLVWGILSGVLVIVSKYFFHDRIVQLCTNAGSGRRLLPFVFRSMTFALFALTLVFFGAQNIGDSFAILRCIFQPRYPGWLYRLGGQMDTAEFWLLNKAVQELAPSLSGLVQLLELLSVMTAAFCLVSGRKTAVQYADTMELSAGNAVLVSILVVWCFTSMTGVTTYLYFKF